MLVVKLIQLAAVVARQAHSRATLIDNVPVPPVGPKELLELETLASQREDAGEVIVVEVVAELPHAADASANTNSRGVRGVTRPAFAQGSPDQPGTAETKSARFARAEHHVCSSWYHLILQRNTE